MFERKCLRRINRKAKVIFISIDSDEGFAMKTFLPKIYSTAAAIILLLAAATAESASNLPGFQDRTVDKNSLRRAFIEEFGRDFKFIKGELKTHTVESENQSFWLAHIKPKRTGYFTLGYSYRYADKFYAEGAHRMSIAVGGTSCTRYPKVVRDIGYFCLTDTIIVPIRLDNRSKHVFSLESKYAKPADIEEGRKFYEYFLDRLDSEKVENPLEPNLKYLGKYRTENLYRSGGGTFVHHAVFKAAAAGKLNLTLTNASDASKGRATGAFPSIPILIVSPGTALTAIVPEERITYYTEGRDYSSDYKNSFESNFLILQPGDVFTAAFLFYSEKPWYLDEEKNGALERSPRNPNPAPLVRREPFSLPLASGYNEWIIDYLPD